MKGAGDTEIMSTVMEPPAPTLLSTHRPAPRASRKASTGIGDLLFKNLTQLFALSILVIMAAIIWFYSPEHARKDLDQIAV